MKQALVLLRIRFLGPAMRLPEAGWGVRPPSVF